ncbi:SpoIIE family protein phosphatase [Pseudokineococcus marinus]|uniref:SpoIIE family protein phosphatase n=1 Tax=Pseudokineococcus marinus TaxID=351215 RepID=A0A849BR15_9ACTN|nr:SpoIIE family protein phosphatase [Pseudokineococcus marinus]NNH23823.1 SpoIIE family protein phosphatase [Pseudokineococcus marinus]
MEAPAQAPASLLRALDSARDGLVVVDASDVVTYANQGAVAVLGGAVTDVVGHHLDDLRPAREGLLRTAIATARAVEEPTPFDGYDSGLELWLEGEATAGDDGEVVLAARTTDARRARDRQAARLTEDLERALDRAHLLLRLSEAVARPRTVAEVADVVARVALSGFDASFAGIALIAADERSMSYVSLAPLPEETAEAWAVFPFTAHTPPSTTARTGRAHLHESREEALADFPDLGPDLETAGVHALAHLPLIAGDAVLGTLAVTWSEEHAMSREERGLLSVFAGYTAQAIQRATLLEQRQHVAETLQRAMLTDLPQRDGLELAALYRTAARTARVGGDWYDALDAPDGGTTLVIGDVAGHDVGAAATMGQLRSMLRGFAADRVEPPSALLQRLDRAMDRLHPGRTATAVVLHVAQPADDAPCSRTLRWSRAGHPAPLLRRPDGEVVDLRGAGDLMLGVLPELARGDTEVALEPGATVLLYTDGLVERRDLGVREGTAALEAALAEMGDLPLPELLDQLVVRLALDAEDDVALLAVRLHDAGPTDPTA